MVAGWCKNHSATFYKREGFSVMKINQWWWIKLCLISLATFNNASLSSASSNTVPNPVPNSSLSSFVTEPWYQWLVNIWNKLFGKSSSNATSSVITEDDFDSLTALRVNNAVSEAVLNYQTLQMLLGMILKWLASLLLMP